MTAVSASPSFVLFCHLNLFSESVDHHPNPPMASTNVPALLLALGCLLSLLAQLEAIGMPTGGGGGCCCGGGGGGGCCMSSCGCGRKKREVVMPHFKGSEVPCPQTEWRELMNEALIADDPMGSLSAIQNALHYRFGDSNKFLVNCAAAAGHSPAAESASAVAAVEEQQPQSAAALNVHFSANGDGYCNVKGVGLWCQAIALHA